MKARKLRIKVVKSEEKEMRKVLKGEEIVIEIPVVLLSEGAGVEGILSVRRELVEVIENESYSSVFIEGEEDLEEYFPIVRWIVNDAILKANLLEVEEKKRVLNLIKNVSKIFEYPDISFLREFVRKPSLIVSGGPSLEVSLPEIMEFQNSFLVIAVSASVKILVENGINPDIVVYFDQSEKEYEMYFKELPYLEESFVVVHPFLDPNFLKKRQNFVLFYPKVFERFLDVEFYDCFVGLTSLKTGLSVAHTACFVAEYLNPGMPIILIAQDLALGEKGQVYPHGARSKGNTLNPRNLVEVKGIDGETRFTTWDYWMFLKYFEVLGRYLRKKGYMVFNATEEGAYIKNFVHTRGLNVSVLNEIMRVYSNFDKQAAKYRKLEEYKKMVDCKKKEADSVKGKVLECLRKRFKRLVEDKAEVEVLKHKELIELFEEE